MSSRGFGQSPAFALTTWAALCLPARCPHEVEGAEPTSSSVTAASTSLSEERNSRPVASGSFADIQVLRYEVPGFEQLSLREKELVYCLYQAVLSGRDVFYDQLTRDGLVIRQTLENIYSTYNGDRSGPEWRQFEEYCLRFWFSNCNYHHVSYDKFVPDCSPEYFCEIARSSDPAGFPLRESESIAQLLERLRSSIFDRDSNSTLVLSLIHI